MDCWIEFVGLFIAFVSSRIWNLLNYVSSSWVSVWFSVSRNPLTKTILKVESQKLFWNIARSDSVLQIFVRPNCAQEKTRCFNSMVRKKSTVLQGQHIHNISSNMNFQPTWPNEITKKIPGGGPQPLKTPTMHGLWPPLPFVFWKHLIGGYHHPHF